MEPLPGRILWVHFLHKGRPIDLLNFYQHTWKGSERVAQLRHRALDILTKTVRLSRCAAFTSPQATAMRSVLHGSPMLAPRLCRTLTGLRIRMIFNLSLRVMIW